ncbi:hypothetical protein [Kribbella speibonae]|uniref:hypothetical protein n=1 Tax=Kribbella speibonae TaxID=1572660 RepID=UPI0013F4376D|nr:hypothetical protein [Kribbella speibonae]
MRSPRVIYGVVAGVLVVAGFVLPRYLAGRSAPELGDTVVVPAPSSTARSTPTPSTPTPRPTVTGASPVAPPPARTAGVDDDDDGVDDPDDDG